MHRKKFGRPSKEIAQKLRSHLLTVAMDEFLTKGVDRASIDGIAKASGVSRTTIYKLYGDKATLFRDVMTCNSKTYAAQFKSLLEDRRAPSVVLKETARAMYRHFIDERNRNMLRMCIASTGKFPQLFEKVRADLLHHSFTALIAYFERLSVEGRAKIENPERMATLFNMMAIGSLKPLLTETAKFDRNEAKRIDEAVDIFMRGCFRR